MRVEFYKHNIDIEEKELVEDTLNSVFLTTGPKTKEFEENFSNYFDVKHGVGVSSWTMGNLITLKALDIGIGDEVITSPMTFIATANTIIQSGATPVFVDVEDNTGNIDASKIESAIEQVKSLNFFKSISSIFFLDLPVPIISSGLVILFFRNLFMISFKL